MATEAPPIRTPAGMIIPGPGEQAARSGALVASAAGTLTVVAALGVASWWYPMIAFLAAGAGAGYSLSGSV